MNAPVVSYSTVVSTSKTKIISSSDEAKLRSTMLVITVTTGEAIKQKKTSLWS